MSNKTTVFILGCGGISNAWLQPLVTRDDIEIVGLCDLKEEAARQRAEDYRLSPRWVGSDLQAGLTATSPDVMLNLTIPEAHHATTLAALNHGCHVFSEKPLASSMEEAEEMIAAAKKTDKRFSVMQNRRHLPMVRAIGRLIASEKLGKLTAVHADFFLGPHFNGFRSEMEHVLLLDMAIHTFDQARSISGKDPVSVYCEEWNPEGSWYKHGANANAIFMMSDNVHFTYRGSWCSEGCNTPWESHWRIICTQGSLTWDGADGIKIEQVDQTPERKLQSKHRELPLEILPSDKENIQHAGGIHDFFDALHNKTTPLTPASDNIKSLAMVFGAVKSAETGQRVRI